MRVFKLKYKNGTGGLWYYSFYWRGKKNQNRILCSLRTNAPKEFFTPAKLEKASARELELMRAIALDKERLERGQSTENVGRRSHLPNYFGV